MSSPIDICNRALGAIRARAIMTDLDEDSTEAMNCKLVYEPTRRELLRGAPWGFARRQIDLSLLGSLVLGTSDYPWAYKYEYPSDCIKVRYVIQKPPLGADGAELIPGPSIGNPFLYPSRANRFFVSTSGVDAAAFRVILSNVKDAIGVYTANVTNCDLFDPLFEEALVKSVAAKLVYPLTGETKMKSDMEQLAYAAVLSSRVADGNEALPTTEHTPDWILARGASFGFVPGYSGSELGQWYSGWDNLSWGD